MNPIVITGGPGAGKTTIIEALSDQGFVTFKEGSRSIIEQQLQLEGGVLPWTDLPAFADLCFDLMLNQKQSAENAGAKATFLDRAIPDIIAYLKTGECDVDPKYIEAGSGYYHKIFMCKPEASIYNQDQVRPHSFEEARLIHQNLISAYSELGYELIDIPWGTVEERVNFIKAQLTLR
ncbi:AAA family ATPase [Vibrio sp. WXL210]|uniref:AAA family ATPase n=1 Tax=Vibrio sp. WXL210 TaxID=3450709 RepID=UPI003EC60029